MAGALVTGIVTLVFNWMMLKVAGEEGVAAVTIIMYVLMFASSLYTGYSYGVAPMLSFYFGEGNADKLKKVVAVSLKVIAAISHLRSLWWRSLQGRAIWCMPLRRREIKSVRRRFCLSGLIYLAAGCLRRCQMGACRRSLRFPGLLCSCWRCLSCCPFFWG